MSDILDVGIVERAVRMLRENNVGNGTHYYLEVHPTYLRRAMVFRGRRFRRRLILTRAIHHWARANNVVIDLRPCGWA